jgi:hypothetical protein
MITEQTLHLLKAILKQNYFQYNNQFEKKGIAIGSSISSARPEIYLQILEEICIKQ